MRTKVMSSRINLALKVSSIGLLGGVIAGCSSGMQRFDTSVYSSAVPQETSQPVNPYPADVDRTTTAGINSRIEPYEAIGPKPVPQGVYHYNEPTYASNQNAYGSYNQQYPQPIYPQQSSAYQGTYSSQTAWGSQSTVQRTQLPKPATSYSPPAPDNGTVYIPPSGSDKITTASVPASNYTSTRQGGWTSTGGTVIEVRKGETLYNLSKRYGVPVSAIRQANAMSESSTLQAGQRLVVPNYVFSSTSPVSAPDNNPKTRASRASTGYLGEASPTTASLPSQRPYNTAAISPSGQTKDENKPRYSPKTHVSPPTPNNTPDYGVVTGSVQKNGSTYQVKSGDTLSAIASRLGTTVSEIQRANGLSSSVIKVGQNLAIPGAAGIDYTNTASVKPADPGVDPIVTGSTASASDPGSAAAPAPSGISQFRWPVKGRIVSAFGERQSSGKNDGIDILVPEGTAVRAVENGVVIYAGEEISMYGKLILVRHADDWVSAYAHNREFEVEKGDTIRRGQIIARSGKTGNADRPKLHFELRKDSNPVDPEKYLAGA